MNTTTTKQLIAFVLPTPIPGSGGWGNGYVAIPQGHPCFEMDYDAIHDKYEIEVNGGLTYADKANKYHPEEVQGMWVVGFDTLHCYDTMAKWPDEASIMREAESLKKQLTNLVLSENGKAQRLCAAAPELLQACKEMIKHIIETDFDVSGTPDELLNRWKAAIKKATE